MVVTTTVMPRGVCTGRNNISPTPAPRIPAAIYDSSDGCTYISTKTRGRAITATSLPGEVYARRKYIFGIISATTEAAVCGSRLPEGYGLTYGGAIVFMFL